MIMVKEWRCVARPGEHVKCPRCQAQRNFELCLTWGMIIDSSYTVRPLKLQNGA